MTNSFFIGAKYCLLATIFFSVSTNANADASVKKRLDERGIKHVVDADGDYKITYNYSKDRRTQLVFVSGKTETVIGKNVREIFSPVASIKSGSIDGAKALELLRESRKNKLGSWEMGGDILYFAIKIPEIITSEDLEAFMDIAAETADDMELELTGKDEY